MIDWFVVGVVVGIVLVVLVGSKCRATGGGYEATGTVDRDNPPTGGTAAMEPRYGYQPRGNGTSEGQNPPTGGSNVT